MGLLNGLNFNGNPMGLQSNYLNGFGNGLLSSPVTDDATTFITIWDTKKTSTGSSTAKQIKLPLVSTGTYNFTVEWGDGTRDIIRAYNAAAITHTYHTAGVYTVKIRGVITSLTFNPSTTDTNKLLEVVQWGCFKALDSYSFNSCVNLRLDYTRDILTLSNNNSLSGTFQFCNMPYIRGIGDISLNFVNTNLSYVFQQNTSFNDPSIVKWDISKVTSLTATFQGCSSFNQDISNWNTSGVTNMLGTFNACTIFNQPVGNWDVSNVTSMGSMFNANVAFNQPLSGWNTSKVASMDNMFLNSPAFDQDIGSWNVSACTTFTSFMAGKTPATFSTANLDAIYNGWIVNGVKPNLSISFGTANYTAVGAVGRAILIASGWTITDGGQV